MFLCGQLFILFWCLIVYFLYPVNPKNKTKKKKPQIIFMMSICSYILMYIDSFYLWKNSSIIPTIQLNLISSSRTVFLFSCLFSDLHTLCKSLSFYLTALIWFSEMWIPFLFSSVDFNFATMYLVFSCHPHLPYSSFFLLVNLAWFLLLAVGSYFIGSVSFDIWRSQKVSKI